MNQQARTVRQVGGFTAEYLDALGRSELLHLALAPVWTGAAASAAEFPGAALATFVTEVVQSAMAERRGMLTQKRLPWLTFWAKDTVRRQLIESSIDHFGYQHVLSTATAIAKSLVQYAESSHQLPPVLRHWARLVRDYDDRSAGDLAAAVRRDVEDDNLSHAVELISAAEAFEPVVGDPLAAEVSRARRLIDLGYRRRHDREVLQTYQRRPEWNARVRQLLDGPSATDGPWALHLLGMGGTGKTMVRYIAWSHRATGIERSRSSID
jgi:hypothetical protein